MKNRIEATINIEGTKVHSLDDKLDRFEMVKQSQKTVVDRQFGTLGEQSTVVPSLQTITVQGTEQNNVTSEVIESRDREQSVNIQKLEVLGISQSSIKLIKAV